MDEITNEAIKQHEIQTDEWSFSDQSKRLYTWFERFNERFFANTLKNPVISFERTRVGNLGHFVLDRNAFGLKWNINVNSLYTHRPLVQILATFLHEMTHQWQQEFGKKKVTSDSSNYHNVEFRRKTKEIGIPCGAFGVTLSYHDPFLSFLREHGVSVERGFSFVSKPRLESKKGKSKLKKWRCRCTNVRVAVEEFSAQCLKCGNVFEQCEP